MSRNHTKSLRLSEQLKQLQKRHYELRAQVLSQGRLKRTLLIKQGILTTWCDSLTVLQLNLSLQQPDDPVDAAACRLQELLQSEVKLLQQLSREPSVPSNAQKLLGQLLQPDSSLIAPVTDPMACLYTYMARPIMAEAATMTAQDVAAIMAKTTQGLSIQLHRLACTTPWTRPQLLTQIAADWDRYLHCILCLVLLGRQDVVEQAHTINLETMAVQPAEAAEHQVVQSAALLPCLRLSEQQQEIISAAMSVYYELLAGIHRERQEINVQMTAASGQHSSSNSSNSREPMGAAGTGSLSSSSQQMDSLQVHQEQLQVHQELTNRLNLLLHKEYKLRMTAMSWFIGSLSYEQLSRLAVMSWPYAPRALFIATEIMQQWERLVKERQLLLLL